MDHAHENDHRKVDMGVAPDPSFASASLPPVQLSPAYGATGTPPVQHKQSGWTNPAYWLAGWALVCACVAVLGGVIAVVGGRAETALGTAVFAGIVFAFASALPTLGVFLVVKVARSARDRMDRKFAERMSQQP